MILVKSTLFRSQNMDETSLGPNEEFIALVDTSLPVVVRELDKHERAVVKAKFNNYDENGDGTINKGEATRYLRPLLRELKRVDPELEDLTDLDKDSDGILSYKEFEYCYRRYLSTMEYKQAEMRAAFKMFDLDGNGYITKDELKVILCGKGDSFGEDEANELIEEADLNRDGKIDYNEFCYALFGEEPPPGSNAKKSSSKQKSKKSKN